MDLNYCQEKKIQSTCQCQPPLAFHITEITLRLVFIHHKGKFYHLTVTECYFEICLVQIKIMIARMLSWIPLHLVFQSVTLICVTGISRLLQSINSQEYERVLGTLVIILEVSRRCFTVKGGYIEGRW